MISIISELKNHSGLKKYLGSEYSFPAFEQVDPEEKKSPEYCLKAAQAGYSLLMRDRTALSTYSYSYIQNLRDYGSGSQSWTYYTNKFKDVSPSTSSNQTTDSQVNDIASIKREGHQNISHKIVSIAPNLKSAISGMWENYEWDIYVNSVDNESGAEEERAMYELLFDTQLGQYTKLMQQEYGLPIHKETNVPRDISLEEMEAYKETGGFKTLWAESMEEVINYTEEYSNWSRTLKRKLISDAVDINFCSAKVFYNEATGKEEWRYVDPANFAIQYSNETNFDDAQYAGEFTLEKIGTLAAMGFPTEKLIAAAKSYEYLFDNPRDVDWGTRNLSISTNKIYDFKVPVFHFQWIDVDSKRSLQVTNKYDKTQIYPIKFGKKVKELSDYQKRNGTTQKEFTTRNQNARQCSWVVDTDMIYQHGLIPNQPKKNKKQAKLSYVAWRGTATNRNMVLGSIIESIVPFLDHLMIAWEKYSDAMVKAHSGGYGINLRLLQNLKLGGKAIDPLDAYVMFWDKGVLPYMDVPMGESYKGGDVTPINRIQGTQGELMTVIQNEVAFVIQMIERVTGINPATVGASPDPNAPVSSTQMALAGTNNVLKPLINGIFEVKQKLAEETALRIPLLLRNVNTARKEYSRIIGEDSVSILAEAERHGAEYGLYMEARPEGEEKQNLITMVQEAMKRGRDGEASVNIGQGFYIVERIKNGGNFKKLQRQVDMMIRKSEQEAFEKKRALIAEQNQQQAQIAQAQQQGKMQEKQVDTQSQMAVDNNRFKNEANLKQIESNLKFRENMLNKKMDFEAEREKQESEARMQERELQNQQQKEKPLI